MQKWFVSLLQRHGVRTVLYLVRRYLDHDISQQGAALAYYLLFALFPLLIFVSGLVAQFQLDVSLIIVTLAPILPSDILVLAENYLQYVSDHVSVSTLWFSAVFSIWFPMRATFCLMRAVRLAYGLGEPKKPLRHTFKVMFFTVVLLFCLVVTLLLMTLGDRLLGELVAPIWGVLRFLALGAIVFGALSALYAAAQDKPRNQRAIFPGAALATLAWILLSFGYAVYVEQFANYSAIYGTLSAMIVLMIWLYWTALTLILGAEWNHMMVTAQ